MVTSVNIISGHWTVAAKWIYCCQMLLAVEFVANRKSGNCEMSDSHCWPVFSCRNSWFDQPRWCKVFHVSCCFNRPLSPTSTFYRWWKYVCLWFYTTQLKFIF